MFWSEHSYKEYLTTYVEYSTLRRKFKKNCIFMKDKNIIFTAVV